MKNDNHINTVKRKAQVAAGAYDGRYKTKVVTDKKKKQRKSWARKKVVI